MCIFTLSCALCVHGVPSDDNHESGGDKDSHDNGDNIKIKGQSIDFYALLFFHSKDFSPLSLAALLVFCLFESISLSFMFQ